MTGTGYAVLAYIVGLGVLLVYAGAIWWSGHALARRERRRP